MVNGIAALHAKFAAIPETIREEVLRAIEKIANEMVKEMRQLAPKDSGALAASINWTWGDAPKGSLTIASYKTKDYGRISATIYAGTRDKGLGEADAFYARFQEFGTQKMAANPFFWPVVRANKRLFRGRVRSAINRALKRLK